jgi:hypothetical protein
MVTAFDAVIFGVMEANAWVLRDLPNVIVEPNGLGGWRLRMDAPAVVVSRTLQTPITIRQTLNLPLYPDWMLCVRVPAGSTAAAVVDLELLQNGTPIDPDMRVLGVVGADYGIQWWNGTELPPGILKKLFAGDSGGGAPIPSGFGVVHVDAVYGSDVSGDGTPSKPYQTLVYAMDQQGTPTTAAQYRAPLFFQLAPGPYVGDLDVPQRRLVVVRGQGWTIEGDVDWAISPAMYDALGLDLDDDVPSLAFHGDVGTLCNVDGVRLSSQFTGDIVGRNQSPGGGYPMPHGKALDISGTTWLDGSVINQASGMATVNDACGPLWLRLDRCQTVRTGTAVDEPVIWGQAEPVAVGAWYPNVVDVSASWTNLRGVQIIGSAVLREIAHCRVGTVDYTLQRDGSSSPLGWIDGAVDAPGLERTRVSGAAWRVGYAGTDPAADVPKGVWFDSYTWRKCTQGGTPQFDNFDPAETPGGRGYQFAEHAEGIAIDSAGFVGNLSAADDTLQKAMVTIDAMTGSGTPVPTGYQNIHVDAHNGSDTTGNGTIQRPYATLVHAAGIVAAPGSYADFNRAIQFVMAPGTYNGAVTMPRRRVISVSGSRWIVTGNISWHYQPGDWFGTPLASAPLVWVCSTETPMQAGLVGNVEFKNVDVASGLGGANAYWYVNNMAHNGNVIAAQSGGATSAVRTGTLLALMNQCEVGLLVADRVAGGERESVSGAENFVGLNLRGCFWQQHVRGCAWIQMIADAVCTGEFRWDKSPITGLGGYAGHIGNAQVAMGPIAAQMGFTNSTVYYPSGHKFGWNGVTGTTPGPVQFDAVTLRSLNAFAVTFDNMSGAGFGHMDQAAYVGVDASGFVGRLSAADDTVQKALATIDGFVFAPGTLSGAVDPNGAVSGAVGQLYYQTSSQMFWLNVDGGMTWVVE